MGNLRKMILGEKMPERDDPAYRERYERDVESGRRFCRRMRLDRLAGRVQCFASRHGTLFLAMVFTLIASCVALNVRRMAAVLHRQPAQQTQSVVERQEQMLQEILRNE